VYEPTYAFLIFFQLTDISENLSVIHYTVRHVMMVTVDNKTHDSCYLQ